MPGFFLLRVADRPGFCQSSAGMSAAPQRGSKIKSISRKNVENAK
jgi:hypothetical protein